MLSFLLKRIVHAVKSRLIWLIFAVVPPLIYLAVAQRIPTGYTVSQSVAIPADAPLALPQDPIHVIPLADVMADSASFFRDIDLLREPRLSSHLTSQETVDRVYDSMVLRPEADGHVRMTYEGTDRDLGLALVSVYAMHLVSKAKAGYARQRYQDAEPIDEGGGRVRYKPGEAATSPAILNAIQIEGEPAVEPRLAFLPPQRRSAAAWIFAVSAVAILGLVLLMEFLDPSLKSERQAARYVGVQVLGSLPDLKKVAQSIERNPQPLPGN